MGLLAEDKVNEGISVIVPVCNEEAIIEDNSRRLAGFLESQFGGNYELLLIDNGSVDETLAKALAIEKELKHVRVLSLDRRSVSRAIRLGILESRKKYAVFYPIDLELDLRFIAQAVEIAGQRSADVVVGLRIFPDGMKRPVIRDVLSKTYRFLAGLILGTKLPDSQSVCLFEVERVRPLARAVGCDSLAFNAILIHMCHKRDLDVTEIPVAVSEMRKGSRIRPLGDSFRTLKELVSFRLGKLADGRESDI